MSSYAFAFTVGDSVYCFDDTGTGQLTTVTAVNFSTDFNPLAYVAATMAIYTTALLKADGSGDPIWRPEGLVFLTKALLKTYVDGLP